MTEIKEFIDSGSTEDEIFEYYQGNQDVNIFPNW